MPRNERTAPRRAKTAGGGDTTRQHREIQRKIDRADERQSSHTKSSTKPAQLGERTQHEPPMAVRGR